VAGGASALFLSAARSAATAGPAANVAASSAINALRTIVCSPDGRARIARAPAQDSRNSTDPRNQEVIVSEDFGRNGQGQLRAREQGRPRRR
jgi:hypothetical protein